MPENVSINSRPPEGIKEIAKWFNEAILNEIQFLEKNSKEQTYELLHGNIISSSGNNATYSFIIADATRIPEDTNGRLKYETNTFIAEVISQDGNKIEVLLNGTNLPQQIYRALLIIEDTALLKKLSEKLTQIEEGNVVVNKYAELIFRPEKVASNKKEIFKDILSSNIRKEQIEALQFCCNSEINFIWGPPGTGKTHLITNLLAALLNENERVLVTSHTKKAVDQALYEAIKNENDQKGVLFGHKIVEDYKVLRFGKIGESTQNLPDNVIFDKALHNKTKDWNEQREHIELSIKPLKEKIYWGKNCINEWNKLEGHDITIDHFANLLNQINNSIRKLYEDKNSSSILLINASSNLNKANRAWFNKKSKVDKAQKELDKGRESLVIIESNLKEYITRKENVKKTIDELGFEGEKQKEKCSSLLPKGILEKETESIEKQLNIENSKIKEVEDKIKSASAALLNESRAIFCTLTKNYVAKELDDQEFDAVIIDEISMALPPLVYLAAGKAKKRVILVGDFKQLPPIIRSDSIIGGARLKHDVFYLSGLIDKEGKPTALGKLLLRKLTWQSRMLKEIATISRLTYKKADLELKDVLEEPENNDKNKSRRLETNNWLDFLPKSPLVVVDTSELHLWCGKQINTLSRFNYYSSVISVDIALKALFKKRGTETIGIITPFAAQRRLLAKLLKDKGLDFVTVGTVHTFQGGEADLIIFDSVLDEPYWAARICIPAKEDVDSGERDLNVAITRAKNKFVFVGSSNWLNKHARENSAMGQFWKHLTTHKHSTFVLAKDLLAEGIDNNSIYNQGEIGNSNVSGKKSDIQPLDELSFFDIFIKDIQEAREYIIGMCPFFGEYRWPKVEPYIREAAQRIDIILITPPLSEAKNITYVKKVIDNLKQIGVTVVASSGLHGKDIFIDDKIMYTGSMNWSSSRGLSETCHRIENPDYVKYCVDLVQQKSIIQALQKQDNISPLTCPLCKSKDYPLQIVNQRQLSRWDKQPLKLACTNPKCGKYIRKIDDRKPFVERPVCKQDGETKYQVITFRNKEYWACPKHPKTCKKYPQLKGDCK